MLIPGAGVFIEADIAGELALLIDEHWPKTFFGNDRPLHLFSPVAGAIQALHAIARSVAPDDDGATTGATPVSIFDSWLPTSQVAAEIGLKPRQVRNYRGRPNIHSDFDERGRLIWHPSTPERIRTAEEARSMTNIVGEPAPLPGTTYRADTVDEFITSGQEAAAVALDPARSLLDDSPARKQAAELRDLYEQSVSAYRSLLDDRKKLEADDRAKPEVLQDEWRQTANAYDQSAGHLERAIKAKSAELRSSLQAEALPVPTDSPSIMVARDEIQLALRNGARQKLLPFQVMNDLAERGGDLAAVVASEWGRQTLIEAGGGDEGFDVIKKTAIKTSLASKDESRRRAALALEALDAQAPRTTGKAAALYSADLFLGNMVNQIGRKVAGAGAPTP